MRDWRLTAGLAAAFISGFFTARTIELAPKPAPRESEIAYHPPPKPSKQFISMRVVCGDGNVLVSSRGLDSRIRFDRAKPGEWMALDSGEELTVASLPDERIRSVAVECSQ